MFLCANKLYNGWEIYKRVLKLEFRPNYIPDIALVDPELTLTCPSPVTIACGLDAFSQLFESYFSTNASVLTDTLAFEGMIRINRSLISVCTDKDHDIDARSDVAYGAYLSGITLANAGLGTVHGIGGAMGGLFDIPHGVACGLLLKPVMDITFKKLAIKWETEKWESKLKRVAMLLSGKSVKTYDKARELLIESLSGWTEKLQLKPLSHYGIGEDDLGKIIIASGNKNNPYKLTAEEMEQVLISVQ
jgi:alcohol dehydrogenase class IV